MLISRRGCNWILIPGGPITELACNRDFTVWLLRIHEVKVSRKFQAG